MKKRVFSVSFLHGRFWTAPTPNESPEVNAPRLIMAESKLKSLTFCENVYTHVYRFLDHASTLIQKWAKIVQGCMPVLKFESHLFEKMNLERTAGKAVIHFYIYFRSLRTIDHTAGFTLTDSLTGRSCSLRVKMIIAPLG